MSEEKATEQEGRVVYEIGYHILSTLDEAELEKAVGALREAISAHGGSFVAEGTPELTTLAYTMTVNEGGKHTKYNQAHFGWIKFDMEPAKADELKSEVLDADKNILRYILLKTVREDTRAQLAQETLKSLEEVKTTGTIEKKPVRENKSDEEVSDEDLDKAVDELVGGAAEEGNAEDGKDVDKEE